MLPLHYRGVFRLTAGADWLLAEKILLDRAGHTFLGERFAWNRTVGHVSDGSKSRLGVVCLIAAASGR